MEISKIIIENFKGIKHVELGPIKPINVLTGRNNSGKSSILSCLSTFSNYIFVELENLKNNDSIRYGGQKPKEHSIPEVYFSKNCDEIIITFIIELSFPDRQNIHSLIHSSWKEMGIRNSLDEEFLNKLFTGGSFDELHYVFRASAQQKKFGLKGIYALIQSNESNKNELLIAKGDCKSPSMRNIGELLKKVDSRVTVSEKIQRLLNDKENYVQVEKDPVGRMLNKHMLREPHDKLVEFSKSAFLVSPYRHGLDKEIPQLAKQLDNNGSNLIRYLHNIALNENNIFQDIAAFVKQVLPEVGRLHPRFTGDENHTLELAYDWTDGHSVNLANMGGGVEQLLILASLLIKQRASLILWEEPESHLHPGAQDILIDLMERYVGDSHIFLTTHSPVFVRPSNNIAVHAISNPDGKNAEGRTLTEDDLQEACLLIGARPGHLAQADIVVYVEGKYGASAIEEWINKWPKYEEEVRHLQLIVQSFNASEVGGDDFDMGKLKKVNPNILFFVDNDADETTQEKINPVRRKLKDLCKAHNVPCLITDYENNIRQIEDYFTLEAVKENLPSNLVKNIPNDFTGPMRVLFRGEGWKRYNRKIAATMKWKDIEKHNDLLRLFEEICKIAKRLLSE